MKKMEMRFQNIRIETDGEKTGELYKGWKKISESCGCPGCRNFQAAIPEFPEEVKEFFSALGIEPEKAAEVFVWHSSPDRKTLHYGGFYHFCGNLLEGKEFWQEGGVFEITENYRAGFSTDIALAEEDLSEKALQLEIDFACVPWVLKEENPY